MSKKWEAVHVDAAFLVVGFLDDGYTRFLVKYTGFLASRQITGHLT